MTNHKNIPKIAFGVFFILGAALIIWGKHLDNPNWLLTFSPAGLMLVYASMGRIPSVSQDDEFGDNLYFLGFIYTMLSLGFALYFNDPSKGDFTSHFTQNLAVALSTTILGIFLRVIVSKQPFDPEKCEEETKKKLNEAASDIAKTLIETVAQTKNLSISIQQQMEEMNKTHLDIMKQRLDAFANEVKEISHSLAAFKETSNTLDLAVSRVQGQITRVKISPSVLEDQMAAICDILKESAKAQTASFKKSFKENADEQASLFKTSMTKLKDASNKLADALESNAERLEKTDIASILINEKLDPVFRNLAEISKGMQTNIRQSNDAFRAAVDTNQQLQESSKQMIATVSDISSLLAKQNHLHSSTVTNTQKEFINQLNMTCSTTAEMKVKLEPVFKRIEDASLAIQSHIQQSNETLRSAANTNQQLLESSKQMFETVADTTSRLTEQNKQHLSEVADTQKELIHHLKIIHAPTADAFSSVKPNP